MKRIKNIFKNFGKLTIFSVGFLGLFGTIAILGGWKTTGTDNEEIEVQDYGSVTPDNFNNLTYTCYNNETEEYLTGKRYEITFGNQLIDNTYMEWNVSGFNWYTDEKKLSLVMNDYEGNFIDQMIVKLKVVNPNNNFVYENYITDRYNYEAIRENIEENDYISDIQELEEKLVNTWVYGETAFVENEDNIYNKYMSISGTSVRYRHYKIEKIGIVFPLKFIEFYEGSDWREHTQKIDILITEEPYINFANSKTDKYIDYYKYEEKIVNQALDLSKIRLEVGSVPNQPSYEFTIDEQLEAEDYINNKGYIDISTLYRDYINNTGNNTIYLHFEDALNVYNYNMVYNFIGQPNVYFKYKIQYNGQNINFGWSADTENENYYLSLNKALAQSSTTNDKLIEYMAYTDLYITYENIGNNLSFISIGDNSGYNMGFAEASVEYTKELKQKNAELAEKEQQLNQKNADYNTLLEHYNNAQMQNPLTQMVVSIADIPLNIFHSLFNFDIMGFNLASFILSIITILLVAYVIKLLL